MRFHDLKRSERCVVCKHAHTAGPCSECECTKFIHDPWPDNRTAIVMMLPPQEVDAPFGFSWDDVTKLNSVAQTISVREGAKVTAARVRQIADRISSLLPEQGT